MLQDMIYMNNKIETTITGDKEGNYLRTTVPVTVKDKLQLHPQDKIIWDVRGNNVNIQKKVTRMTWELLNKRCNLYLTKNNLRIKFNSFI